MEGRREGGREGGREGREGMIRYVDRYREQQRNIRDIERRLKFFLGSFLIKQGEDQVHERRRS